jgi:cytochrome c
MKSADIEWNDKTLDEWIEDPQHLVPGNEMTFAGIKDARQRADLLAFLKQATQPGASVAQQGGSMGGMGGMDAPNARCP